MGLRREKMIEAKWNQECNCCGGFFTIDLFKAMSQDVAYKCPYCAEILVIRLESKGPASYFKKEFSEIKIIGGEMT